MISYQRCIPFAHSLVTMVVIKGSDLLFLTCAVKLANRCPYGSIHHCNNLVLAQVQKRSVILMPLTVPVSCIINGFRGQ